MKYLKVCLLSFIGIILCISILSILYYYNIIGKNIFNFFKIILFIIIFSINGYKIEKISNRKYYGILIFNIVTSIILLFVNYFSYKITFRLFIYLLLIICSNIFGGFIYRKKRKRS